MDLVLEQFLAADNAGEEERLQELMSQAQPIIRRVVAGRLHDLPQEVEDICSDAQIGRAHV